MSKQAKYIIYSIHDMKDYQYLLQGSFKKRNVQFDLKENLTEVLNLAQYKAKIGGINIKFEVKFSSDEEQIDNFVSIVKFDELKKTLQKVDDAIENHPLLVKVS